MKNHLLNRLLSLCLATVMVLGLCPTVSAAPGLRWEQTDVEVSWDKSDRLTEDTLHAETIHKPTDMVRVSIVLNKAPTIQAGYATMGIGSNPDARAYDRDLRKVQETMARTISAQALGGKALDVVWNLTLVSNIISANIPYGRIDAVKAVEGVRDVVIERRYETTNAEAAESNMYTSSAMIGSSAVWQSGMTGAGTRIAIVDTGTDTDHQSFNNAAYLHALELNGQAMGMSYEEYVASLDLLDAAEINAVIDNLNVTERVGATAEQYYINEKLPFGANYVDCNLTVDHDDDMQGSHGSHVAGIAAANRYIPDGDTFADARQTVHMSGVAPDAQIITLKVFGNAAGPYDSDYFAAIEDAIWLGCDSVNLSLGSGSPGYSENYLFEELLDYLAATDTVVVISAGNSGHWAQMSATGYLYNDGVSFHTAGSPGTYTNSLAIASVENDGTLGNYIQVGDTRIVYTETTGYANAPMVSLDTSADLSGTEYDYVFVDGIGEAADYAGIDLTGKIVFCHRGTTSFYEKANIAAGRGAAAVVICNNTDGIISMDLTDYVYRAPCVSILQSDGAAVRAASTQQTTDAGLTYYTGRVTISGQMGVSQYNSEYYTMSSFSSWGVPTSLELKPELTAPGGMIWSVNGVETSGTAYEMMSGTSMAAPQVTGMAALAAEYIRAKGLDRQTGLSVRELAQSLLMSTAQPLREGASGGEYYSILNQGAGLARIDLATTAESYILVDGMADGKVKVELGEDADREGKYTFTFSINDLSGEAMTYALSADLFTQDVFSDANGIGYLDTWTRSLPVKADFIANGQSLEGASDDFVCDLNGDGLTTAADADYLLEHLVGNETALKGNGDVNGDGSVTSYDAHVLLTKLSGAFSVDVPANGSVTIEAQLELTDETREFLDACYPTGAYIEAFVFAEPVTDSEGELGVTHSIPVLGYYGSWSEPSMYDVGSYLEYSYGAEIRAPYLYQVNGIRSNYVTINYGDGDEYLFGGNPFVAEDAYLPERNAFNNQSGSVLQTLRFTQIRNAAASMVLIENADSGEILMAAELGQIDGAYYHANQGAWQNTQNKLGLGLGFEGIEEGTRLNVSLVTAPELYCTLDEETGIYTADWSKLKEGAYLTTSFTIDNTAPAIQNVELGEDNTLYVTAEDSEYIAAVALMNLSGTSILTAAAPNQTERGAELTTALDLNAVFGSEFLLAVFDYAENATVVQVSLELDNERPYFTALDRTNVNSDYSISYVGMNADGSYITMAPAAGREPARAAEYVQGAVFEISNDNRLYVAYDEDLYSFTELGALDPNNEWAIVGFNDLAYNMADGKLYSSFYSELNGMAVPVLSTIDMFTGELTVLGEMPIDANTLAIDGAGNFYSTIYGTSQLYTYRSDVTQTGKVRFVGGLSGYATTSLNSLAWDHNADTLYWTCPNGSGSDLLRIDPDTAAVTQVSSFPFSAVGLYIAYEPYSGIFAPTDTVDSVSLPETAATMVNNTIQLTARVRPWNAADSSVTWTSSDPAVATVDENGLVFGLSEGTAVITAASVLDPAKTASCTVTVTALRRDLKGLIWDEEGQVHWASFNTASLPAYESLSTVTPNLPVNATMVANGTLYASTLDLSSGLSDLYIVDPETFEMAKSGGSLEIAYLDMAYAPSMGYGLGVYFNYVCLIDLASGEYIGAWDWSEGVASDLVGITYYGSEYHPDYEAYMDYFLLLDASGNVYLDAFIDTGYQMGYFNGPQYGYAATIGEPVDYSYFQGFYYDGSYTYWSRFNEADNVVELIAWDCDNTGEAYTLGYFADSVWPVGGLYCDAEINGTMALAHEKLTTIRSAELMTAVPTVELEVADGSLNAAIVNAAPVVKPMSKGEVNAQGNVTVELTIPAETFAPNGTMFVSFDPEAMELVNVAGNTAAFAWKQTETGKVMIAFADREALTSGEVTAVLSFNAIAEGETAVQVRYGEWGTEALELLEDITVTLPHICPSGDFVDVNPGDWWHEAVDYVVSRGYMKGMDAAHYGPGLTMNRAQFVTVLYRMEGEPTVTNTGVFTDVPDGQFYTEAAYWALEAGITTGATADTFNPGGQLTRTELVTFMYRYAAYKGYDTATGDLSAYTDADQILPFAVNAWSWAVSHGIVSGMTADTLAPMSLTNRAQAATIFQRFDSKLANH